MGYDTYGSDLEQRMVDYSARNLEWLHETQGTPAGTPLEAGDATSHSWQPVPSIVAGETYLGQPFSTFPGAEKLEQVRSATNTIHRKFLQNIARQLQPGTRLCLAVPAWQRPDGTFLHLSTLDHLEELGYNRVSFKHVETRDLIYARADQIVARELLVLIKS
jgi:tRNA G10  N-methylase Trm11